MKEYCYPGPASGVTLLDGIEILLRLGKTVSLSEKYDYVKVLVTLKHLTPGPEDTGPAVTPAVQSPKCRNGSDSEVKMEDAHGS